MVTPKVAVWMVEASMSQMFEGLGTSYIREMVGCDIDTPEA